MDTKVIEAKMLHRYLTHEEYKAFATRICKGESIAGIFLLEDKIGNSAYAKRFDRKLLAIGYNNSISKEVTLTITFILKKNRQSKAIRSLKSYSVANN